MKRVTYTDFQARAEGCQRCKRKPIFNGCVLLSFLRDCDSPYKKTLASTPKGELEEAVKHGNWYCYFCLAIECKRRLARKGDHDDFLLQQKQKRKHCADCSRMVDASNCWGFCFVSRKDGRSVWELLQSDTDRATVEQELANCDLIDRECQEIRRRKGRTVKVNLVR
jgi:hypothetical protein